MPIYKSGKYTSKYSEYFNILVDSPNVNTACKTIPLLENLSFVISIKDVPLSGITCDGHGVWKNDGVRHIVYSKENDKYAQISKK